MIRVGYRTQKTGVIYADTNAKYNMQQAAANGIKVGVYFFSSAVNESEAIEEDGEEQLAEVEDEELLDKLAEIFESHFDELYESADEE